MVTNDAGLISGLVLCICWETEVVKVGCFFSLFSKVDNKPCHSQEDYLARLCKCKSSPDHWLLAFTINT